MNNLVVARLSGALMMSGRRYMVRRGVTVAAAGHPLVTAHPRAWEPLQVHYPVVEQATAAPGELRAAPLPTPQPDEAARYRCDRCGATARTARGLATHRRSCQPSDTAISDQ